MRYCGLFCCIAVMGAIPFLLGVAGGQSNTGAQQPTEQPDNLAKYVGRALAVENRAARVGISRLSPQSCPPFYLRDEFDRILDSESTDPVNVARTCMKCHDVETVTGGYHFQMGLDELRTPHTFGESVPLQKGPGIYGKWLPLYQRELAPKSFENADKVDMTSFEWVISCGICHPGGGPAEFDRGGLRYDQVMAQDRGLAYLDDGDYHNAQWDKSGTVGVDCFICHLDTYDYSSRAQQIKKYNFKWAATVAAGLGTVAGSVTQGDLPKVAYRKDMFQPDGTVRIKITRPGDRACLFCHDSSGVQKRGTTWSSNYMQDVHTKSGMKCTDCHPGDIRHNFAKGFSSSLTARDDLDGSMQSCKTCHYETGDFGAPAFEHKGFPQLHLDRLSCQACHITKRPFLSCRVVDTLTGKAIELPNEVDLAPPTNLQFGALWGKVTLVTPEAPMEVFTREELDAAANLTVATDSPIRKLFATPEGGSRLPDTDFTVREFITGDPPVVDTADERALMLLALEQTAQNTFRAVCVFRGKAYRMAEDGLRETTAKWSPKRVGSIAEYTVAYATHEREGRREILPEGYQVAAFWAHEETVDGKSTTRPLFLKDMKAAWDYLQSHRVVFYPAKPASGVSTPEPPKPGEASEADVRKAISARIAAYNANERKPLGVWDDNFDLWPEANTEEEIGLVAWAIKRTMKRLESPALYYIVGQSAYLVTLEDSPDPFAAALTETELPPEGQPFLAITYLLPKEKPTDPQKEDLRLARPFTADVQPVDLAGNPQLAELAQRLSWTISHGVEPAHQALGAKGCTDCHSTSSPFFFGAAVTAPWDRTGQPTIVPMHRLMSYSPAGLAIGAWRESVLKPLAPWAVLAVFLLILLHFVVFGVRNGRGLAPDVVRFRLHERLSHLVLMLSVMFLAVTGFFFLLGKHDPLGNTARNLHAIVGYVAIVGHAAAFLCWAGSMICAKGDLRWMLRGGGYLGGVKGHLPAGKFNAGQKILFWKVVFLGTVLAVTGVIMALNRTARFPHQELVYTIHDVAALLMILLLMGHIYLGAVVVPHSLRSLFGGKVSSAWAKEHHPDWKPRGLPQQASDEK